MADWNSKIIEEFRANEGKVGGPFEGAPLLLLHTVGARTGQQRVNPMMYRPVRPRDDGGPAWLSARPPIPGTTWSPDRPVPRASRRAQG